MSGEDDDDDDDDDDVDDDDDDDGGGSLDVDDGVLSLVLSGVGAAACDVSLVDDELVDGFDSDDGVLLIGAVLFDFACVDCVDVVDFTGVDVDDDDDGGGSVAVVFSVLRTSAFHFCISRRTATRCTELGSTRAMPFTMRPSDD